MTLSKTETWIVIWISATTGSLVSYYLPKYVEENAPFHNVLINAAILGLIFLAIIYGGLKLLKQI